MNLACRKHMSGTRKAGFTLIELLVYIAIVGIVVIVAGQAFSNSTKMRMRTQSMIKASEVAENVASLFKVDVAQTGAKSSMETHVTDGSDDVFSAVKTDVYMNPGDAGDSSSFRFAPASPSAGANLDTLIFRRVRYNEAGKYQAVEEIRWSFDNGVLKRTCQIVSKASGVADGDCESKETTYENLVKKAVEITTDVTRFQVLPSIPGSTEEGSQVFPSPSGSGQFRLVARTGAEDLLSPNVGPGGKKVQLNGFQTNFDEDVPSDEIPSEKKKYEIYAFENSNVSGGWDVLCGKDANKFSFDPGKEYEISFKVSVEGEKGRMFVPGKDHMAVGFRKNNGSPDPNLPDFMFYPPLSNEAKNISRVMRFSVGSPVKNVCFAFTFSFFSPLVADGTVFIEDLKLREVPSASYRFDPSTTHIAETEKKNVKALLLNLEVKRNGEAGSVSLVVPIPSNGPRD